MRNVLNVLDEQYTVPDGTNYGWLLEDGTMLPVKGLKSIPTEILNVCLAVNVTPDVALVEEVECPVSCFVMQPIIRNAETITNILSNLAG